jgi:hypothetical protein
MSINERDATTSNVSRGTPDGGFLRPLRAVALVALLAGAVGSEGLMFRAGHPPFLLRVLFVIWVLSPFAALLAADMLANMVSKRWSIPTRATLYSVMLVIALGSLAVYVADALGPPKSKAAVAYVVVPTASWLLLAIVVPIAALLSRRD